jgi:DNA-binding beta-propeller fold protein YncE
MLFFGGYHVNVSGAVRSAISVSAAVVIFGGCSSAGSVPPLGSNSSAQTVHGGAVRNMVVAGLPIPAAVRPDRRSSWVSRSASSASQLLYVSDLATDDVYIFAYPQGTLEGKLTGFGAPFGLCSDTSGNVYVADNARAAVYEYAHGSNKRIATIKDTGEAPYSCAVDPTSGTLAVTNYSTKGGREGSISVYTSAQSKPKKYKDPYVVNMLFCTYDNAGNLFADANFSFSTGTEFALAQLPKGGTSLTSMTSTGRISRPGGVAWDGQDIGLLDGSYFGIDGPTIWKISDAASSQGTFLSHVYLSDATSPLEFWTDGTNAVVANFGLGNVGVFNYQSGGAPTQTITTASAPVGVTISEETH